ncbi:hypothetical protein RHEC894_PE00045 (plasmid) [Rhizobium sp. CIAT894]|nr:hypothetical protein RHEC894_PE00045 [Rhizobium sp. CIAT894]
MKSGAAKISLYRHCGTRNDLIAAFLKREDLEFWSTWDQVTAQNADEAGGEFDALPEARPRKS